MASSQPRSAVCWRSPSVQSREDQLLDVLEKIGVANPKPTLPDAASTLDADGDDPHYETTGPREDLAEVRGAHEDPPPSLPTPITKKNLFVHHDTHPVVFDVLLLKQYQEQWFTWESTTLWKEIKEDFRVPSISDQTKAKIQAVKTLHINEWFWTKWEVFCWITQAINNNIPDFHVIQKPSIPQLLASIDIATYIRSDETFSSEVQKFVAAAVVEEGVFYAVEPIRFCQDEIEELLTHLQVEDAPQLIQDVQKRYREVSGLSLDAWMKAPHDILHETPVDTQVAKLIVASDYLALRRRQLKDQLRILT